MSILFANHSDIFNKRVFLALKKLNLPIETLITSNPFFLKNKKIDKKTQILDIYDFYYKDRIFKLNKDLHRVLTLNEISKYYELESVFLKIADRLSYRPLSTHQILPIYYELLLYWINYFDTHDITLVVFSQSPHTGYDNIIYYIALQKKIPVLIPTPTLLSNRIILRNNIHKINKIPSNFLQNKSVLELKNKFGVGNELFLSENNTWSNIGKNINSNVIINNTGNILIRVLKNIFLAVKSDPKNIIKKLFIRSENSGFVFCNNYNKLQEYLISFI